MTPLQSPEIANITVLLPKELCRKLKKRNEQFDELFFFKKKFDSLHDLLRTNKILTVFELFIFENIVGFLQLTSKAPKSFIILDANDVGTYTTQWNMKKLLPAQHSRTVLKRCSFEIFLRST